MTIECPMNAKNYGELLQFEEKGNKAIQNGKMEECLDWYLKGLHRAKELNYRNEIRKFTLLVATII